MSARSKPRFTIRSHFFFTVHDGLYQGACSRDMNKYGRTLQQLCLMDSQLRPEFQAFRLFLRYKTQKIGVPSEKRVNVCPGSENMCIYSLFR